MKKQFWIPASLAALLAASYFLWLQKTPTCVRGELRFESPQFPLGRKYTTSTQIYNDGKGLAANIVKLTTQISPPVTFFNFGEIQSTPPHPFGNKQVIRLNTTSLVFDLRQNTKKVEFDYLDKGGTINLGIVVDPSLYIGSMYLLPSPLTIRGVTITKSNVQDITNPLKVKIAEKGTITLTSSKDIGSLIIGGQELFLDNFCFN